MPIYSYHCDNCEYEFDVFQHFNDDKLVICPKCDKPELRKLFTPVGIVFKGSGFYATDHRSPSGMMPSPHESESSETKEAKSSGDNGTESAASSAKPETSDSKPKKTKEKTKSTEKK
jgi:putative FmdB family regulatory protein